MAKMRSPNYPALGLNEAIGLVRKLWDKEKRTAVTAEVAVKAMGYKSLNGATRGHLSALRKYGLVEGTDQGVRVSELAMRIIHNPEGSPERQKAIQEAGLKPELFRELYETHGEASDDALKSYLLVNKAFSEAGARQFISAFRDTFSLVRPTDAGYNPEERPSGGGGMDQPLEEGKPSQIKVFAWNWTLSVPRNVRAELKVFGQELKVEDVERLQKQLEFLKEAFQDSN